MVQIRCPDCLREMTLSDDDLMRVVECAACEARIGPLVEPVGTPPLPPTIPPPAPRPRTPAALPAAAPRPSPPPAEWAPVTFGAKPDANSRPGHRKRLWRQPPKKKSYLPLALGLVIALWAVAAMLVGVAVMARTGVIRRTEPQVADSGVDSRTSTVPRQGTAGGTGTATPRPEAADTLPPNAVPPPAAEDTAPQVVKKEPETLEGRWVLQSVHGREGSMTPKRDETIGMTITGNTAEWSTFQVFVTYLKAGKGTISVDQNARPPRITIKADRTYQGVYSLRDIDSYPTLTITFGPEDGGYPTEVWDYESRLDPDRGERKIPGEDFSVYFVRPERPGKPDPRLEGTWKVVSATYNGEERSSQAGPSMRLKIKDGKITLMVPGDPYTRLCRVDSSKSPAVIDQLYDRGDGELEGEKGIYTFKGKTLVICTTMTANARRPRQFLSLRGDYYLLMTLVRDESP
jgi:uncharacterized protein (TIGR03067 family)